MDGYEDSLDITINITEEFLSVLNHLQTKYKENHDRFISHKDIIYQLIGIGLEQLKKEKESKIIIPN